MHKLRKRYRYSFILLKQLVKTDFKLRYQGSVLGYLWSLLRPLLLFATLYIVFAKFLKFGQIEHYPQYLLLGILLWNYFVEVTSGSVAAIVSDGDLIRKINFPKYIIIFAGSFSAFINLLLNSIVLAVFMAYGHVAISDDAILIIPLLVAELFIFSIALAFFLSALYVRFRDVSYIWEVIIQAAFYATPILYVLSIVPHDIAKFLILNPMAQIIQDARHVLITPQTDTIYQVYSGSVIIWAIPIGITLITAILAAAYFRSRSKYFAEEV